MTALIVLAALFVLFAALSFLPIGCRVVYEETLLVQLRFGPVRVTLYPTEEKKPMRLQANKKQPLPRPKPRKTVPSPAELLPAVSTAAGALDELRRTLKVRTLRLRVFYGAEDAFQRALRYGQAWAVLGTLTALLENAFRIRSREVCACFDPEAVGFSADAELEATLPLGRAVRLAGKYGLRLLRQLRNNKRAVQTNESSSV